MERPSRAQLLDAGLLLIRVGLGLSFVGHGWPKLVGGPEKWAKLGTAMEHVGIELWPTAWGFLAAVSEAGGGLLVALGVLFRPACGSLVATMAVAAWMHHVEGDGFGGWSHALEAGIVFAGLLLSGPGRWAIEIRRRSSSP